MQNKYALIVVIVVCMLLTYMLESVHSASCSGDRTCGLRSFLSEMKNEYEDLACIGRKLNMTIEVLVSANSTNLSRQIQIRRNQLNKITVAQQNLAMEISVLNDKCTKNEGEDCNLSCFSCSGHGKCSSLDVCQCDAGWTGNNCSIPICYNIPANVNTVCNGLGTCVSNNTCVCRIGVSGNTCTEISIVGDDASGRRFSDGASAKSCNEYLKVSIGSTGSGNYWIKPDSTEFKVYCEMSAAGGVGLTALNNNVQTSTLNTGSQSRYYVYLQNVNTWYKSPPTTLSWEWSTYKSLGGSYVYTTNNGGTLQSFSCSPSENGSMGVGCSNGSGGNSKVMCAGRSSGGEHLAKICQDNPKIFGDNCVEGIAVYIGFP